MYRLRKPMFLCDQNLKYISTDLSQIKFVVFNHLCLCRKLRKRITRSRSVRTSEVAFCPEGWHTSIQFLSFLKCQCDRHSSIFGFEKISTKIVKKVLPKAVASYFFDLTVILTIEVPDNKVELL